MDEYVCGISHLKRYNFYCFIIHIVQLGKKKTAAMKFYPFSERTLQRRRKSALGNQI